MAFSSPFPTSDRIPPLPLTTITSLPFPLLRLSLPRRYLVRASSSERPRRSPPPPLNLPDPQFHQEPPNPLKICTNFIEQAQKALTLALCCIVVRLLPLRTFRAHAVTPLAAVSTQEKAKKKAERREGYGDHEFSDYTRKLLAEVSVLLRTIEGVKAGKGEVDGVKKALKDVKEKRGEIQGEVLGKLNVELRELRKEKEALLRQSSEVMEVAFRAQKEQDRLLKGEGGNGDVKEKVERLETSMDDAEEYNGIWDLVGETEYKMSRRETLTFSIAIRELSFIERES